MSDTLDQLRYPIGKENTPRIPNADEIAGYIVTIEALPLLLRDAVRGLSDEQLDTPYREGGWTVRQVVHHLVDSHMNAYMRHKLTLTEDEPTIRPYFEERWAELPEAKSGPIDVSLDLLQALHRRWVLMLRQVPEDALQRKYYHPQSDTTFTFAESMGSYAWHCNHHLAHITRLKERMNWN